MIATAWSGPSAYLDETVGYPLNYTVTAVPDEMDLPGHQWAEPSVAHLRQLMRRVFVERDEARARGAAARQRMLARYSPAALADDVAVELERLASGGGGARGTRKKRRRHKKWTKEEL